VYGETHCDIAYCLGFAVLDFGTWFADLVHSFAAARRLAIGNVGALDPLIVGFWRSAPVTAVPESGRQTGQLFVRRTGGESITLQEYGAGRWNYLAACRTR